MSGMCGIAILSVPWHRREACFNQNPTMESQRMARTLTIERPARSQVYCRKAGRSGIEPPFSGWGRWTVRCLWVWRPAEQDRTG